MLNGVNYHEEVSSSIGGDISDIAVTELSFNVLFSSRLMDARAKEHVKKISKPDMRNPIKLLSRTV